jgi:hypothetical protein
MHWIDACIFFIDAYFSSGFTNTTLIDLYQKLKIAQSKINFFFLPDIFFVTIMTASYPKIARTWSRN